jgi:sugar lactone lactonase YvrE
MKDVEMKVGEGTHEYEWIEGWAKLPAGKQFGYTHGVAVDSQNRIYIFNQSPDAVCVFDSDGNFIKSWGEQFAHGAHGMFLNKEDGQEFLYLTDYVLSAVFKYTLDGEEVWPMGAPPLPHVYQSLEEFFPTDVCVAPGGDLWVCDGYGKSWVHHYGHDGEYRTSLDGTSGAGRFACPHGARIDTAGPEPLLWIADRGNVRIQQYRLDGTYAGSLEQNLRYPCNFVFTDDAVIVPDLHGRVTILNRDGSLIAHLGDNEGIWQQEGWPNVPHSDRHPGKFNSPHGAEVDLNGDLYVAEWVSDGRVTKLRRL